MTRLEVAPRAAAQIREVAEWWRANRPAAPLLFSAELADTLESLVEAPRSGARYAHKSHVGVRRVLLRRTRYHVYFSYDEDADVVAVRAVWHASRGAGPRLR